MFSKIIWFSTTGILAVGVLIYEAESQELKKEVQVQNEIIKACESDRIRLLNQ